MKRFLSMCGILLGIVMWGCGDGTNTNNAVVNPPSNNPTPLTITPTTATNPPGQPTVFTIAAQSATPPANPVVLSVTGLPANAAVVFDPPQIPVVNNTLNGTSTLTITTDPATPAGTYPLTVQGTVGTGVFGTTQLTLTVQPAGGGQQNFNLTVTPSSASVSGNTTATFDITVTATGGFSSPVTLSLSGQNGNFLISNPTPNTLNFGTQTSASSTFTVSRVPGTSGGTPFVLTITATGNGITRTATVTVL